MYTTECPVCRGSARIGQFVCGRCDGSGRVWCGPARAPRTQARTRLVLAGLAAALTTTALAYAALALEVLR